MTPGARKGESVRTCSRCGMENVTAACPACTEEWENRRDAESMTAEERAAEFDSWGPILEIDFAKFHERMQELVGRPIWTHEFARPELLRYEITSDTHPSFDGVVAKLPPDKPLLVVEAGGDEGA